MLLYVGIIDFQDEKLIVIPKAADNSNNGNYMKLVETDKTVKTFVFSIENNKKFICIMFVPI